MKFDKLGCGSNAPDIVRMYGMDSEVQEKLVGAHNKPHSTFDYDAASQSARGPDFSISWEPDRGPFCARLSGYPGGPGKAQEVPSVRAGSERGPAKSAPLDRPSCPF